MTADRPASAGGVLLPRSYLTLDANHRGVRAALIDVQLMHRLIMTGWRQADSPQPGIRAELAILYALDLTTSGTVRVVTQAAVEPHWQLAPGTTTEAPVARQHFAPLDGAIEFQLTAAPTRNLPPVPNITPGRRARGRRVPLPTDEHLAWGKNVLTRRAGLTVRELTISNISRLDSATKSLPPDERPIHAAVFAHTTVTYHGVAEITDPDTHCHALIHGIGRAKSWGCGLLLTRPYARD
ncbi:type I-E CRISPR-associated protein Cas6/Cse3/CasE [Nocardia asiatica]|uniref:type I-E CRISPR-associated protein Cas6/Cse3/CasE n=1 Tax=Nocardia asiatica TaxID=209252 RepID=UPI0002D6AF97|nr:type I-E CRISPR-associated protein Cas6/Cse3/CasE [Nocardia asiatica]